MKIRPELVIGTYAMIAVITFGIAFNKDYDHTAGTCDVWCSKDDERMRNTLSASVKAMLWPLYLSVTAFESLRKEQKEEVRK